MADALVGQGRAPRPRKARHPRQAHFSAKKDQQENARAAEKHNRRFQGGHWFRKRQPVLQAFERPLMTPDEVSRAPARKEGQGLAERIVAPGQMLIFVSGHFPILGTQMLYFLDPVLRVRAELAPPSDFYQIEDGSVIRQRAIAKTRNRISKPETTPADASELTECEKGFIEELQLEMSGN